MWTWVEQWLKGTRPPPGRTWRPKIRQRQVFHRQRLYGGGYSEPEPARDVDEDDMPPERRRLVGQGEEDDVDDDDDQADRHTHRD